MYQANVYNIMIGCPSDISTEEVQTAFEVIYEWNAVNSQNQNIVLLPMHWSKNSYPLMGKEGQKIINDQITDKSDVMICLFAGKVGTPTSTHESGTIEELQSHIEAQKPAMVLFKSKISLPDPDEYSRLCKFKSYISQKGLYAEFESVADLRDKLQQYISQLVNDKLSASLNIQTEVVTLNDEEKDLLKQWAHSGGLETWYIDFIGGHRMYRFGRIQVDVDNSREIAKYNIFLNKLEKLNLLEFSRISRDNKKVMQINQNAFEYIDSLTE